MTTARFDIFFGGIVLKFIILAVSLLLVLMCIYKRSHPLQDVIGYISRLYNLRDFISGHIPTNRRWTPAE